MCGVLLATVASNWLGEQIPLPWYERYARRFEEYRLPPKKEDRYTLAEQIGADGLQLLQLIDSEKEWTWLREIPAVQIDRARLDPAILCFQSGLSGALACCGGSPPSPTLDQFSV